MTYADICWHLLTYDDIWWHMMTYDNKWWHMMINVDDWWWLMMMMMRRMRMRKSRPSMNHQGCSWTVLPCLGLTSLDVDPKAQHLSKWNVGDTHLYPYAVIIDEYVKSGYLAVSWHIHICIYIYRHIATETGWLRKQKQPMLHVTCFSDRWASQLQLGPDRMEWPPQSALKVPLSVQFWRSQIANGLLPNYGFWQMIFWIIEYSYLGYCQIANGLLHIHMWNSPNYVDFAKLCVVWQASSRGFHQMMFCFWVFYAHQKWIIAHNIRWMEEILHHLGWFFNPRNNGINHLSTGAGILPSTVSSTYIKNISGWRFWISTRTPKNLDWLRPQPAGATAVAMCSKRSFIVTTSDYVVVNSE